MNNKTVCVIGGGASGLCAAIAAAREMPADRLQVMVLEAADAPARKIPATGNGRCNLTNRLQERDCYRSGSGILPERFYLPDWDKEVETFMGSLGVPLHERRGGYLYPRTDQALVVSQALVREAAALGVRLETGMRVLRCEQRGMSGHVFYRLVCRDCAGREQYRTADRVILAPGGMVSEAFGCVGDGYRLAMDLGHSVNAPHPALCALLSDDDQLRSAAGIRTSGRIRLYMAGRLTAVSEGELQLTRQGISGIPAFQVSRYVSAGCCTMDAAGRVVPARREKQDCRVSIDFLPEFTREEWEKECGRRLRSVRPKDTLSEFCMGLVPDRVANWLIKGLGLVPEKRVRSLDREKKGEAGGILRQLLHEMRNKNVRITGTEDFSRAQVTAGGISLSGMTSRLESRLSPGVYCAGEVLDVDGMCGGYNLTWAIHSGLLSGRSAARSTAGATNAGDSTD